jgi:hypothetical protein
MRYIKYRTIISKIADTEILDRDVIRAILNVLKDKELDCGMQLTDGPYMKLVRIMAIEGNKFAFITFKNHTSLRRNAELNEILQLEVYDLDADAVYTKPDISRWLMLEPDKPGE